VSGPKHLWVGDRHALGVVLPAAEQDDSRSSLAFLKGRLTLSHLGARKGW
jgi:hypothetical protein